MYNSNSFNEIIALYKNVVYRLKLSEMLELSLTYSTINNKLNSKLSLGNKSSTIVLLTNTIKKYWFAIQKDLFT